MKTTTPLTNADLSQMAAEALEGQTSHRLVTWVPRLVQEIRDARRLLRALRSEAKALVGLEREELMDLVGVTNVRVLEHHIENADSYLTACKETNDDEA